MKSNGDLICADEVFDGGLNLTKYYNNPLEVRAYIREITEQVLDAIDRTKDLLLSRERSTDAKIQHYLIRQIQNRILKDVVTAI